ncbi:cytochrome P450 [Archangium minus]|uniref:Cytochrome P450 n=1 Tax=Archangium minus TaxID=83450 RepID=A0ABY9X7S4_9BACT|nr:cytochrome P450 [Archangium minus]
MTAPSPAPPPAAPRIATGPRGLPLIGVVRDVRKDVLGWLTRTAAEHGPVAQYRFGPGRAYLVTHPDGRKHVLQDHVKNYTKDHYSYAMVRRIVGDGLLTSQGETWLKQRRLAQPAFHRARISAMAGQEFWPEPERFDPDRFTPEKIAARPRYAYFPFLGGPRQCIGNNFALMEGTLILATLAQHHRPRMVAGYTPTPEPLITLRPSRALPVLITAR